MIAGLAGADVSGYASGPFDDVQAGSWYAPYVNWAAASGIVSGTSATTFDPAAEISRQDMAVMLYNYAQQAGVQLEQTTVTPFTDEGSIAAYALPAVQALHSAGVISGMQNNGILCLWTGAVSWTIRGFCGCGGNCVQPYGICDGRP